jgi:hypothetical protein
MRVELTPEELAVARSVADRCNEIMRRARGEAQRAEHNGARELVERVSKRVKLPRGVIKPEIGKDGFTVAIHVVEKPTG